MSRCLIELGLRGWSWNPSRVARAIRHRDTCVVVVETDRRISGFAIAEFGDMRMHLSLLAVEAAKQRHGIGRALVQWLEKSALTAGITAVELELRANNAGARFFYEAMGFALVRAVPGYYRGEEAALKMGKLLAAKTARALHK